MAMTCNGICHRYKAAKQIGKSRYILGQKRCNGCEIFIKWDGLWCPCCNYKLRSRPRVSQYKARFWSRQLSENPSKTSLFRPRHKNYA